MEENKEELKQEVQEEQKPEKEVDQFLHTKYVDFEVTPFVIGNKLLYEHGSKGLTKMLEFKKQEEFGNNAIDYYMGIPTPRQEGEEIYEDIIKEEGKEDRVIKKDPWKMRLRFQQALYKYRKYIYKFKEKIKSPKGIAYAD